MSDISLGRGIRQNLFTLQQSSDLISTTQNRLATGKKVNTAIDNPTNFFTAQSLNSRAKDLNGLLDGISNSLKTVEAADNGIRSITKLVENAQSVSRQARALTAGATTEAFTVASAAPNTTSAALGAANNGQLSLAFTPTGGAATNLNIVIGGAKTFDESIAAINDSSANRDASGTRIVTASKDGTGKLVLTARNGTVAINATQGGGVAVGTAAAAGQSDDEVLASLGITALATTSGGIKLDTIGEQRQSLAKQYNDIREQISRLAKDSGFNGVNLLNSDQLSVTFNERTDADKALLTIKGTDFTAGNDDGTSGLKLKAIDSSGVNGFQKNSDLDDVDTRLNTALASLRSTASTFGSQLAIVQTRKDFTNELVNTLKSGADSLVLANSNEEAANLLTLQTRQQLSSQALALASQQEQSVLRLLG
jgi:flagellin